MHSTKHSTTTPNPQSPAWNYESLYANFHRPVFHRALSLLRRVDTAMDATQEVFLRLLHSDGEVLQLPDPTAWLYRVTTNLCLNKIRDSQRRSRLLVENERLTAVPADAESRTIVRDLLDQLTPELRRIAVLHYFHDMTHDEIADALGVSRRTICYRMLELHDRVMRAEGTVTVRRTKTSPRLAA
jgi:RNA polymerase sigma-70 factor (ECF subfamily)